MIRVRGMSESAPVVDWEFAGESVAQDKELLLELVKTFLGEGPETMDAIRRAIAAQDAKTLQRAAHTMKGLLRIFGARPASDAAWKLEEKGRQGDITGTDPLVADLQEKLDAVIQKLTDYAAGQARL